MSDAKQLPRGCVVASIFVLALGLTGYIAWGAGTAYSTSIGGFERVVLREGTVVELSTNSLIRVRIRDTVREVELVRGEAAFKIAPDANRSFIVHAGGTTVRALGTEFNVRLYGRERTDVQVNEGRVEVGHGARASAVSAGEIASDVGGIIDVRPLEADELAVKQSWRRGLVLFRKAPLSEVIVEFNRYSYRHVAIQDQALAAKLFGGSFSPVRADNFISGLTKSMGLRVSSTASEDGPILLERDGPTQ